MHGEEDELVELVEALHDPSEPRLRHVRLAVDRRDDVGPGLVRDGEARPGDRREDPVRVGHHVADDVDPAEDSFSLERRPGAVVGAEEEPGEAVGLDPVPLLRHLEVAASKSGLDVGEGNGRVRSAAGAGERRVRVAVDEHEVGRLGRDPLRDRRLHGLGSDECRSRRYRGSASPSWSKNTCDMTWYQCWPVWRTTSSTPASRSAAETGTALTNCGRFPTTVKTFTGEQHYWPAAAGQ